MWKVARILGSILPGVSPAAMRFLLLLLLASTAGAQSPARNYAQQAPRPNLYACEGCEAVYDRPHEDLSWRVTIPAAGEPGEPLILSGRVLRPDGRTPAAGVVLYVYHTNAAGLYPTRPGDTGWARRHGFLRAWLQTDAEGRYEITTNRPGSYPDRPDPAHIHVVVEEPGRQPYWIDEFVFAGDPRLTDAVRDAMEYRGGSGLVDLTRDAAGTWRGDRTIVLER